MYKTILFLVFFSRLQYKLFFSQFLDDGRTKPEPRKGNLPEPQEYKCLIRANLGNKKISTVINQKDVNKFQMAYANVLKGNMDGLKKKDKRSATKSKSKATQ